MPLSHRIPRVLQGFSSESVSVVPRERHMNRIQTVLKPSKNDPSLAKSSYRYPPPSYLRQLAALGIHHKVPLPVDLRCDLEHVEEQPERAVVARSPFPQEASCGWSWFMFVQAAKKNTAFEERVRVVTSGTDGSRGSPRQKKRQGSRA